MKIEYEYINVPQVKFKTNILNKKERRHGEEQHNLVQTRTRTRPWIKQQEENKKLRKKKIGYKEKNKKERQENRFKISSLYFSNHC